MNNVRKLVLVLTTVAAASVGAQTIYSGSADQERRERNREEALSHYRTGSTTRSTATEERSESMREKTHEAASSVRRGSHRVAESTRRVAHKTAAKARDITDRTNAKFPAQANKSVNPDGINPMGVSTASPTAPSNGITK